MRITFNIPECTRNERNSHCGVLHITPDRVANIVMDDAIAAYSGYYNVSQLVTVVITSGGDIQWLGFPHVYSWSG